MKFALEPPPQSFTEAQAKSLIGFKVMIITSDVLEIVRHGQFQGEWFGFVNGSSGTEWPILLSEMNEEWQFIGHKHVRHARI